MNAQITPTDLIAQYIKLRDKRDAITAEYKAQIAPYEAAMEALENAMTAKLLALGPDEGKRNISTNAGVAFRQKWTSVRVEDRDSWLDFVFNIDGKQFITTHVAKDAVTEWIDEHNGNLPPGIKYEAGYKTIIRRS